MRKRTGDNPELNNEPNKRPARGRPPGPEPLRKRNIDIPDDLWEWAVDQPEGGARLVRDLLGLERRRRTSLKSQQIAHNRSMEIATPGGIMVATEAPNGILILFEEELAVQCLYDISWGRLLIQVPSKIQPLEVRMAEARQRDQMRQNGPALSTESTDSSDEVAKAL